MRAPIDIEGFLTLSGHGVACTVRGAGREVVCDLPDFASGWALLWGARRAPRLRPPLGALLEGADVRLSLRLRGRVVAEAGPGVRTGRLAGWLGLRGVRFRWFQTPDTPAPVPA